MDDQVAIKVAGISKTFKLPHEKNTSIKGALVNFYKKKTSFEKQVALKDISFEVKRGEFFGIVGRNGSGKSTLLKLLAGIYVPDSGSLTISGSLTPFIELGVGFNPELTGRENIYLNGALLGFNRKQMDAMYHDIVSFAELQRFMDQKLKNYSSGMQVRLAFSIAIRAKSDILLIDEVLAVGDAAFQKKCFEVFRELKKQGRTIILVTHDMGNVERFCDRALIIDAGQAVTIAKPHETAAIYARLNVDEDQERRKDKKQQTSKNRWGNGGITIQKAQLLNSDNRPTKVFTMGEELKLKLNLKRDAKHQHASFVCGLAFYNQDGVNLTGPNSHQTLTSSQTAKEVSFSLPSLAFTPGDYAITIALHDEDFSDYFDVLDKWLHFSVIADHVTHGVIEVKGSWTANS